jgi:hypothetical protein
MQVTRNSAWLLWLIAGSWLLFLQPKKAAVAFTAPQPACDFPAVNEYLLPDVWLESFPAGDFPDNQVSVPWKPGQAGKEKDTLPDMAWVELPSAWQYPQVRIPALAVDYTFCRKLYLMNRILRI